jgi:hypothetical protein
MFKSLSEHWQSILVALFSHYRFMPVTLSYIFFPISQQNKKTNPLELILPREAASWAATQETPGILWNQTVHHSIHKSSPLVSILCQTNPVHNTPSYSPIPPRSMLILSTHLRLGLLSGLFPSVFIINTYVPRLLHQCCMACPSHHHL